MSFLFPPKDRKPLFTLRVFKRHIFLVALIILIIIFGYATYFKFFMTLPQSAIHILSDLPVSLEGQKIIIIAPHCDDEMLSSGGLIQEALLKNSEIKVVMVTDCNYQKIGATRRAETITALNSIGITADKVKFLNFPEKDEKSSGGSENEAMKEAIKKEIIAFSPTVG